VVDGQYDTQGWNRYSYVKNNPIIYKDPTGHLSLSEVGSELLAGAKESLSGYANTAKSIASAVTNPSSVIDKVKNAYNNATSNPVGFAKNTAKAYGNALADSFKQITGMHYVDKIAKIATSDRPIKEIGKQVTDVAVDAALNYAGAKLAQGAGKLLNKAGKLFKGAEEVAEAGSAAKLHGNSLKTTKPAEGYTLRDLDSGEVMKYGETTRGTKRYSQNYLKENNLEMQFEAKGTKKEMHDWQHDRILEYKNEYGGKRPPLNKSDW
jgi:hypothetical protein